MRRASNKASLDPETSKTFPEPVVVATAKQEVLFRQNSGLVLKNRSFGAA
jgi:hypothetical protein